MTPLEKAAWKDDFGFQVSSPEDPDLMLWLFKKWIAGNSTTPEEREAVNLFISFGRQALASQYITGIEYLDKGIGLILSNGERVPFVDVTTNVQDGSTVTTVSKDMASVSITGGSSFKDPYPKDRSSGISVPIT
jgi:hypothetical protein